MTKDDRVVKLALISMPVINKMVIRVDGGVGKSFMSSSRDRCHVRGIAQHG